MAQEAKRGPAEHATSIIWTKHGCSTPATRELDKKFKPGDFAGVSWESAAVDLATEAPIKMNARFVYWAMALKHIFSEAQEAGKWVEIPYDSFRQMARKESQIMHDEEARVLADIALMARELLKMEKEGLLRIGGSAGSPGYYPTEKLLLKVREMNSAAQKGKERVKA